MFLCLTRTIRKVGDFNSISMLACANMSKDWFFILSLRYVCQRVFILNDAINWRRR